MEFDTSLEAFQALVIFIRRLARFVGIDILTDSYQPNVLTALTLAGCLSYIVIVFYSAWFFYPDIYVTLQSLAPVGVAFQGAAKLYVWIIHKEFFYGRMMLLEDFHRKHARNPRNNAVLLSLMRKMHVACRLLIAAYFISIAGFSLYPLYHYLAFGERIMAVTIALPGIDVESIWGYSVSMGYQLFLLLIAITGISASDTTILIFVSNLAGLVDVYKNDLLELDELLDADERDEHEISIKLKQIIVDHLAIIDYESDLGDRYEMINFVQVASSVSCLTLSLFLCYMTNYIPGYGFVLAGLFQLLEFCLLGTIFTVKNDELTIAIYNTKWYLLNNSQRKMLCVMFHNSQNPVELTIGGLALLNIETFVEIMKKIYQCFAMMIRFIK